MMQVFLIKHWLKVGILDKTFFLKNHLKMVEQYSYGTFVHPTRQILYPWEVWKLPFEHKNFSSEYWESYGIDLYHYLNL